MLKEYFKDILESRIERIPFSGCWIWIAHLVSGYGNLRYMGETTGAHRVAWWIYRGPSNGLDVLHKCDIRCCINPDHLYLGTAADNSRDYWTRNGWHYNDSKTECKHGHPLTGFNLMIDNRGDRLCRECNRLRSAAWRRGEKWPAQ